MPLRAPHAPDARACTCFGGRSGRELKFKQRLSYARAGLVLVAVRAARRPAARRGGSRLCRLLRVLAEAVRYGELPYGHQVLVAFELELRGAKLGLHELRLQLFAVETTRPS